LVGERQREARVAAEPEARIAQGIRDLVAEQAGP